MTEHWYHRKLPPYLAEMSRDTYFGKQVDMFFLEDAVTGLKCPSIKLLQEYFSKRQTKDTGYHHLLPRAMVWKCEGQRFAEMHAHN